MADQHGQPTSGTGNIRKRKVSDDIIDSTVAETKFRKTSKNPPKVAEDVTVLRNKDIRAEAKSLDHGQLPIDILLLTVKDCEFLACLSFMTSFTKRYENDLGFVYIGSMCESSVNMKIAVMKCRMGAAVPGGSAGVVRDAVKALTPKAVFCVGYCGGLNPAKVKLGDVVISEKLITYAPSKVTQNGIEELGDRVPPSTKLGKLILNAADGWEAPLQDPAELEVEVKRGALLSGPQMVDNNELREALIKGFPNGIATEMEGEGVYGAADDLDVEWIIIKGVSEFADGTKSETNSWRPFASLMAASLVAHILQNPIIFENWGHYNDGKSSILSSLGERVLQSSHREHASQSNDSKTPVSSGIVIKDGIPTSNDLQLLSLKLGTSWKSLARRLKFDEASVTVFDKENDEWTEKALSMLQMWKAKYGSGATFRVLHDALCHEPVYQRELAEQFCYDSIPAYVDSMGEKAQASYRRALAYGSTYDKRVKILIVGQDRVGKTSLGKFLRGERFDRNEPSTNGVKMFLPVKNAGTDAWRNLDNTHVFDHKVTAEMTRQSHNATAKPQNEIEKAEIQDQMTAASKEEVQTNPGGRQPLSKDVQQGNIGQPSSRYVHQGNPVQYGKERDHSEMTDTMSEDVETLYKKRLTEGQNLPEDTIWPVIWDFAGQDIYHAIHPIFMSPDDIYLLAFDLTKDLHDRAVCQVNMHGHKEEAVEHRNTKDTNLDHVMRWMNLVHALKNSNGNKRSPSDDLLPPSLPPVFLVGTHADLVDPSKTDEFEDKFRGVMKTLYDHVVDVLPIDNTKSGEQEGQEKILTLREKLLKVAENMPHTRNQIPLQWHRVEKELSQTISQEKKYVKKEIFKQIASQFCIFQNEYDVDALLYFLHARGSVIYGESTTDEDGIVFLDPPWLISLLTKIINVNPFDEEALAYSPYRKDLQERGILHKELLDFGFRRLELGDVKDTFISLMEKFNLICKWPSGDSHEPLILVPCMLTSKGKEENREDEVTSACCAPLYLTFEGTNYVPVGLFCRLVALVAKWISVIPEEEHTYSLAADEAQFCFKADHFFRLVCYKRVIELCISTVETSPPKHCAEVLSLVKESMKTLKKDCHWLRSMQWNICVRCTICMGNNTECCELHNENKCLHHDCGHYIPLVSKFLVCKVGRPLPRDTIQPWIDALQEKPETTRSCAVRPGCHDEKEDVYRMKSSPRGEALIINNETFLSHSKQMDDRQGSKHDVRKVQERFQALGFKVTTKENLTKSELMYELDAMAVKDHSGYDCFVLWLMSHGDKDLVYGTDGGVVFLDTVRDLFSNSSCPSLDGKPKVFFIQACRGDREEFVVSDGPIRAPQKSLPLSEGAKPANQVSHSRAHFLEAYSAVDGFYSYRNEDSGSHFVQCLVEVFRERFEHDDIDTMLIEVNRRLSQMQGRVRLEDGVKQVKLACEFINRLTKKLYF